MEDKQSAASAVTPVSKGRHRAAHIVGFIIAGALLALGAGFLGSWLEDQWLGQGVSPLTVLKSSADDGNKVVTAEEVSITAVAKKVSPSIVSIISASKQATTFYNQTVQQQSAGTGMIVSSNGYILTNKHVVDGASTVTVILANGKTYRNVEVVGTDPLNDLAFLKISNVSSLPSVTLGDSKTIRVGQSVVAIGNALGQYQNTVTSGIISGTGRPVVAASDESGTSQESLTDLIQTDAAINSGNSGGPLLNLKGQVVGINTAIAQDANNIGFSIPIGAAKGLLAHVIKTGKVERPYLGIRYISITPEVRAQYKLSVDRGDYVTAEGGAAVVSGSPAAKAGLRARDIITKVNGYSVGEVASVSSLISEYEPGDTVQLTVLRGTQTLTKSVTLAAYNG